MRAPVAACVQVAISEIVFPDEPTARAMHVMPPAVDECLFLPGCDGKWPDELENIQEIPTESGCCLTREAELRADLTKASEASFNTPLAGSNVR